MGCNPNTTFKYLTSLHDSSSLYVSSINPFLQRLYAYKPTITLSRPPPSGFSPILYPMYMVSKPKPLHASSTSICISIDNNGPVSTMTGFYSDRIIVLRARMAIAIYDHNPVCVFWILSRLTVSCSHFVEVLTPYRSLSY